MKAEGADGSLGKQTTSKQTRQMAERGEQSKLPRLVLGHPRSISSAHGRPPTGAEQHSVVKIMNLRRCRGCRRPLRFSGFFEFFENCKKDNILTHFWLPGVPESNSASKTLWVHSFKSIFPQNSKTRLFHKVNFFLITLS